MIEHTYQQTPNSVMLTSFTPVHSPGVGRTMTNVLSTTTGKHPKCILAIHWICVHRMTRNRTTSQNHHPRSMTRNRTTRQNHHPRRKEKKKEETDGPTTKQEKRYEIIIAKNRFMFENRRHVPPSEVRTCLLMCFYALFNLFVYALQKDLKGSTLTIKILQMTNHWRYDKWNTWQR